MSRLGARITAAASWALIAGLFVAPLTLGKMTDPRDMSDVRDLWAHLLLCAIGLTAAVGGLLVGRRRLCFRRTDAALLALPLAYVAASFVTVYPRGTLAELMRLLDYLALYALVRVLLRGERLFLAGALAFAGGGVACAVIGLQQYLPTALRGDPSWRTFGPFYNPNLLAAMLLMSIPMWIALLLMGRLPTLKAGAGVALGLSWLCFFVTGSKGGALALMGALAVGAILAPDPAKGGLLKRALGGIGLVALAGAAALLLPPIRIRLAEALGAQSNSTMFRYYTWVGTWHMALARPVLGFGPGAFAAAYPRFAIVGHTWLAHETYLQIAAETGFVGVAALLAAMGSQLLAGLHAARRLSGDYRAVAAAATAGMVGFCLHNVVDYAWHVTATGMAVWVLAGLVGAAWDHAAEPEPQSAPQPARTGKRKKSRRAPAASRPVPWLLLILAALLTVELTVPAALALHANSLAGAQDYQGASRLDPLNDAPHRQSAMMAQQVAAHGRPTLYGTAIGEWQVVQRLRPTYPGTHYNLALIYEALGRTDQALAEYADAERLAPTYTEALAAHVALLARTGNHAEAVRVYGRLDALLKSPLFRYRAVTDDLDPSVVYAWIALGDGAPPDEARTQYVRAARYLRQVTAANRRMEGIWRSSGEWQERQAKMAALAEQVARRHATFPEPGPRLRAALLLVDAGRLQLARELFVRPGDDIAGEAFFGRIIGGWASYLDGRSSGIEAQLEAGRSLTKEQAEAKQGLADEELQKGAAEIAGALQERDAVEALRSGPDGWSEAELAALQQPLADAKQLAANAR